MGIPLHLEIAMGELGVAEWPGSQHNPRVLEYIDSTPAGIWSQTDELAWCGAFGAWSVREAARQVGELRWRHWVARNWKPHRAREWLRVGEPTDTPLLGDVCVLQLRNGKRSRRARNRTGSARGGYHMGFYQDHTRGGLVLTAGNISDKVGTDFYSFRTWRVAGFRAL